MFQTRRARLAGLFALILIADLALLCCALGQIDCHCCPGHGACAICEFTRMSLRSFALLPAAALTLLCRHTNAAFSPLRGPFVPCRNLFTLRVRLND